MYGLTEIPRHVIQRTLNPRLLSQMASYDPVSDVRQTLQEGTGRRGWWRWFAGGAAGCGETHVPCAHTNGDQRKALELNRKLASGVNRYQEEALEQQNMASGAVPRCL